MLEDLAVRLDEVETYYESGAGTPEDRQRVQELKEEHQALEEEIRKFYRAIGLLK